MIPPGRTLPMAPFSPHCNQSFNPWPIVARFDSHLNIPASHLGIPGGIVNLEFRDVIDPFCL